MSLHTKKPISGGKLTDSHKGLSCDRKPYARW